MPILFPLQDARRCGSVSPLQPGRLNGAQGKPPTILGTTWNPSDKSANVTLSQNNTVGIGQSGNGAPQIARATASRTSAYQDFYFEVDAGNSFAGAADVIVGLDDGTSTLSSFPTPGRTDSKGISYRSDGNVFFLANSFGAPIIATYARGQRIGVAVSPSRGKVWFAVNNKWDGDPVAGTGGFSPGLSTYIPFAGVNNDEFFFGYWDAGSLLYSPPSGFVAFDDAAAASSDVTAALTGQSVTVLPGSLLASMSLPLTGQTLSAAQGTLAVASSAVLAGQSVATGQGSVGVSSILALTGQEVAVSRGSLLATTSLSLTGQAIAADGGSLLAAFDIPLAGQAMIGAQGTVTAPASDVTAALTGQSLVTAQGALAPAFDATLAGQSLIADVAAIEVAEVTYPPVPPIGWVAQTKSGSWTAANYERGAVWDKAVNSGSWTAGDYARGTPWTKKPDGDSTW